MRGSLHEDVLRCIRHLPSYIQLVLARPIPLVSSLSQIGSPLSHDNRCFPSSIYNYVGAGDTEEYAHGEPVHIAASEVESVATDVSTFIERGALTVASDNFPTHQNHLVGLPQDPEKNF
ncbi:unnamed protein product [Protopolystoma xenopodis]|uniref:Uncharacterized protein n=1 Tax=Protopolystoma xenopodis TaxID=117903 RepID=A0A448X4B2_9PLAT|nr:unnamed protein product [Protopolystoma xenopodis]